MSLFPEKPPRPIVEIMTPNPPLAGSSGDEMFVSPSDLDPRALQEAVDWMILLAEDDGDEDQVRDDFDAWLAASDTHAAAWARTVRTSGLIEQTANVLAMTSASARRARAAWPPRVAAGLGVAAAIATMAVFAPGLFTRLTAEHVTGMGQERVISLADGSTARLAPGSVLDVAYRNGERRVRLKAGEAFFEVRRDPTRPFLVEAGDTEVTVLGTGFDVRRGRSGDEVGVRHGRVRVERPDGVSALLTAGDWVRLDANGARRGQVSPSVIGAWSAQRVVAVDRPLGEVAEDLDRSFQGRILVTDKALAARSVTGVYDASHPVDAVRALARPHHAVVRQITPWLVVISAG